MNDVEALYQEEILENYKNPKNFGSIKNSDAHAKEDNPFCGDEIEIFLKISKGKVSDVKFQGKGCAISQASASFLTEHIKGKTVAQLKAMKEDDILKLVKVNLSIVRMKCGLLPFWALRKAIEQIK